MSEAPSTKVHTSATGPKGISEGRLKAALRKHAGVYALAARELGCDRSNVHHRVVRSPKLLAFVAAIEDEVGDATEAVIKGAIIGGDRQMARWYAELKLADRGYRRRVGLTDGDGAPLPPAQVVFNVTYVKGQPEPEEDVL